MIDQIIWKEVLPTEEVTIVLPPILIRELNHHKDSNPNTVISSRAGKVLKKLYRFFEESARSKFENQDVEIILEDREPQIDFAEHQLSREVPDDYFVGNMIMMREEQPADDIILATSDYALHLLAKARRLGISTICIDEKYRLKREKQETTTDTPILEVLFDNERQHFSFELEDSRPSIVPEYETLESLKSAYPKKGQKNSEYQKQTNTILAAIGAMGLIPSEEYERYNNELDGFYENYSSYLDDCREYSELLARKIDFQLIVKNSGKSPAIDIDVVIHFPDGFELMLQEEFPLVPKAPEPPTKPLSQMARIALGTNLRIPDSMYGLEPSMPFATDFNGRPNIERTNSFDVTCKFDKVKHHMHEEIDGMCIVFDSVSSIKSFEASYQIVADNVPTKIEGSLNFVIKRK